MSKLDDKDLSKIAAGGGAFTEPDADPPADPPAPDVKPGGGGGGGGHDDVEPEGPAGGNQTPGQ